MISSIVNMKNYIGQEVHAILFNSGLTPYFTSISSTNNQEGLPAPGFPEGIVPVFLASTFMYRAVVGLRVLYNKCLFELTVVTVSNKEKSVPFSLV